MKAICYKKIYPFGRAVFEEKFVARTVPFHERIGNLKPLGRKLEGRVFKGEIKGDRFEMCTYPDIWHLTPLPHIRKIPAYMNPSCLYGSIQELDGHTIVNCIIDLSTTHKIFYLSGMTMDCFIILLFIVVMFIEFQLGGLIVIVILVLDFIKSNSALQAHQSEHEALIKFMEDLEKQENSDRQFGGYL